MNDRLLYIGSTNKIRCQINNYRVPGERIILYLSMLFCAVIFLGLPIFFKYLELLLAFLGVFISHIIMVKIHQAHLLGQCVKLSENQVPKVFESAKSAASKLKIKIPDIFIKQDPTINAYAIGFIGKKSVILHSETVSSMQKEELISVLGHEFSHIKLKHTNWSVVTNSASGVGIPILSNILQFIFLFWSRKAEFSCDRGSIIASEDLQSSVNALVKIAVGKELSGDINIDDFINQGKGINGGWFNRFAASFSTHPYLPKRVEKLKEFYEKYVIDVEETAHKEEAEEIDEIDEGKRIVQDSFNWFLGKKIYELQRNKFIRRFCLNNLYIKVVLFLKNEKILNNLLILLRNEKKKRIYKLEIRYYEKILEYIKIKKQIKQSPEIKSIFEGTCTKCNSTFKIDHSIIPKSGIYVRCHKCAELFFIKNGSSFQIIVPIRVDKYFNNKIKNSNKSNVAQY